MFLRHNSTSYGCFPSSSTMSSNIFRCALWCFDSFVIEKNLWMQFDIASLHHNAPWLTSPVVPCRRVGGQSSTRLQLSHTGLHSLHFSTSLAMAGKWNCCASMCVVSCSCSCDDASRQRRTSGCSYQLRHSQSRVCVWLLHRQDRRSQKLPMGSQRFTRVDLCGVVSFSFLL